MFLKVGLKVFLDINLTWDGLKGGVGGLEKIKG